MAIPPGWYEICNLEDIRLQKALQLLKSTFAAGQYDNLKALELQRKMGPGANPETPLFVLRVFSHGSPDSPDISGFFFLRRRHGAWAYCLTVGAVPTSAGMPAATLQSELEAICRHMRTLAGGAARLDVMHQHDPPNFKDPKGNLAIVYNDSKNARPPKLRPDNDLPTHDPWPEATLKDYVIELSP